MTKYLLDTNTFIEAKNRHYGLDFCPAFWNWLVEKNTDGKVASVQKVGAEIAAGQDDLSDWAKARGSGFFLMEDAAALTPALTSVSNWVNGQNYERAAIAGFLGVADYWLIAHAKAHNYTIVTHELPANSTRKIKIPNVCQGMNIPHVNPFEMLRLENARFVLGQRKTAV